MQSYARAVRSEFSEEIGYLEEQYKTVKGELTDASQALHGEQPSAVATAWPSPLDLPVPNVFAAAALAAELHLLARRLHGALDHRRAQVGSKPLWAELKSTIALQDVPRDFVRHVTRRERIDLPAGPFR